MKAIIIEDETAALSSLKAVLQQNSVVEIEVIAELESIEDSVEWFQCSLQPDLIFMDIHLADGLAFKIFEQVDIVAPVVFTTAYDEYALEAFRVSSIDYLLKPVTLSSLEHALNKFFLFNIYYFYTSREKVTAYTFDGKKHPVDRTLDTLGEQLDQRFFFRANRQFIISRKSIRDVNLWLGNRLSVNLLLPVPERIIISKVKTPIFKKWLMQEDY